MKLETWVNWVTEYFGFHVSKLGYKGVSPTYDIGCFLKEVPRPLIFDVGANIGQTVEKFKLKFPSATIHSFEPGPTTYETLQKKVGRRKQVFTWNLALGSKSGRQVLLENQNSDMSSLLELGERGWGAVNRKTEIEIKTLDQFCAEQNIGHIDLLKSDTQGFDLEVFKGADTMLRTGKISLIYCEITFSEIYKNMPSPSEIVRFLAERNFRPACFYYMYHTHRTFWTDGLFVHDSLKSNHKGLKEKF
jgi:FkbM family methyltransferase